MRKSLKVVNPFFLNPFLIYIIFWIITVILYIISPAQCNVEFDNGFILFLIITLVFSSIIAYKFDKAIRNKEFQIKYTDFSKIECGLFIILCFIDLLYGGINPLYAVITGIGQEVKSGFGIPVLHVFIFTYGIYISSRDLFKFLIFKKAKLLILPLVNCIYCIFIFSRAGIVTSMIVVALLYLSTNKFRMKVVCPIIITGIVFIWIFGIAGNIRVGYSWNDSYVILTMAQINSDRHSLLSPFYWTEEYIICSLRNLLYNINTVKPAYNLADLIYYLLPDFISKRIVSLSNSPRLLIFTTYTMYGGSYVSFGYVGMAFSYIIHLILGIIVYGQRRKKEFNTLLAFSFMSFIMALSVFDNMIHVTSQFLPIVYCLIKFKKFKFVWRKEI